jgi:HAE1 family hydrophobic/amphiphilic exporter-1
MSIAKAVVQRPVLWLVVFALVSISGIYLLSNIAVEMLPELQMPALVVSTVYPGADPETVEKTVTAVLEAGLANTGGIVEMSSTSSDQASIIVLEFEYGVDMDVKINRVRENIDLVESTLPENAQPPRIHLMRTDDEPVMRIAVRGNSANPLSQNELRFLAKENILDQLKQIEGVASCDVEGGQDAIVQIVLFQNRLEAYGITISEITGALASQNMELGAGSIDDGPVEYSLKTSGAYASLADIAGTVVTKISGADIRLLDIGEVTMAYKDETSAAYINGEPGVYIAIMKQSGANTVTVADNIYRKLDSLGQTLSPGIRLEIIQDSTLQIRAMIQELSNSMIAGVILAILVLFLFFRSINSSLIIGLSIPISFLITLLAMSLTHVTINMMTLAGLILGLGMVVDSSIVVLESTLKFREKGEKLTAAAVLAGEEVMPSIIASTLTTICVFLPLFLFKDQLEIIGILVQDLLFTIGISIVSSLLVAIFLVPVLASKWLPVHSRIQKPLRNPLFVAIDRGIAGILDGVNKAYTWLLSKALHHRLITILLVAAAFAGSGLALLKLPIVLMPDMDNDTVTLSIEMPLGTRYDDTQAVALEMQEYVINEINGYKNITTEIGSSGSFFGNNGNNAASITVTLDLDNTTADSAEKVKEKFRAHFAAFPNAVCTFPVGDLSAMLSEADIDLIIRADDLEKGFADATAIKMILEEQVPEVQDIAIDMNAGMPQVNINIDRQRAYNMGLNVVSIASEIAASMNGITATTFRQAGDEYDVILRLAKEDRYSLPDLGKIFVRSSTGMLFPVSNFAQFGKIHAPVSIQREGQARVIHVTADVKDGYRIQETEAKIASLIDEQGLSARFSGESAETSKMLKNFVLVITLALLLVFGVMAAQYESFRDPFINFCTIPLILIGVVAIHLITGQVMNAFTMIGFVMLAGIVVNNGIILVDYTNILVRRKIKDGVLQGKAPKEITQVVFSACLEAGNTRFRPVLMTALTTMFGLAPMAFFPGKSSQMTAPIGLAVFGGLASATVITLFFIPVLYSLINGKPKEKRVTT